MISVGSVTINSYLGGKDGEILKTVSVTSWMQKSSIELLK